MTVLRTARGSVIDGDFWLEGVGVRFFSSMIRTLKMAINMDIATNVTHLLSMVSYNYSGYTNTTANNSSTYLKELVNCSKCDILCLQENWEICINSLM